MKYLAYLFLFLGYINAESISYSGAELGDEAMVLKLADIPDPGKIAELYLCGNGLTKVPNLSRFKNLKKVSFKSNEITLLQVGDFNGLPKLRSLCLSDNSLESLPVGVFNGLGSLEVLEIKKTI
jgi:Leucine-rich repeat (LRR) protein